MLMKIWRFMQSHGVRWRRRMQVSPHRRILTKRREERGQTHWRIKNNPRMTQFWAYQTNELQPTPTRPRPWTQQWPRRHSAKFSSVFLLLAVAFTAPTYFPLHTTMTLGMIVGMKKGKRVENLIQGSSIRWKPSLCHCNFLHVLFRIEVVTSVSSKSVSCQVEDFTKFSVIFRMALMFNCIQCFMIGIQTICYSLGLYNFICVLSHLKTIGGN